MTSPSDTFTSRPQPLCRYALWCVALLIHAALSQHAEPRLATPRDGRVFAAGYVGVILKNVFYMRWALFRRHQKRPAGGAACASDAVPTYAVPDTPTTLEVMQSSNARPSSPADNKG